MPERFTAEKRTIVELFGLSSPSIEVSNLQRDYSWETDQVKAFWGDLVNSEKYPRWDINAIEIRQLDFAAHAVKTWEPPRMCGPTRFIFALPCYAGTGAKSGESIR